MKNYKKSNMSKLSKLYYNNDYLLNVMNVSTKIFKMEDRAMKKQKETAGVALDMLVCSWETTLARFVKIFEFAGLHGFVNFLMSGYLQFLGVNEGRRLLNYMKLLLNRQFYPQYKELKLKSGECLEKKEAALWRLSRTHHRMLAAQMEIISGNLRKVRQLGQLNPLVKAFCFCDTYPSSVFADLLEFKSPAMIDDALYGDSCPFNLITTKLYIKNIIDCLLFAKQVENVIINLHLVGVNLYETIDEKFDIACEYIDWKRLSEADPDFLRKLVYKIVQPSVIFDEWGVNLSVNQINSSQKYRNLHFKMLDLYLRMVPNIRVQLNEDKNGRGTLLDMLLGELGRDYEDLQRRLNCGNLYEYRLETTILRFMELGAISTWNKLDKVMLPKNSDRRNDVIVYTFVNIRNARTSDFLNKRIYKVVLGSPVWQGRKPDRRYNYSWEELQLPTVDGMSYLTYVCHEEESANYKIPDQVMTHMGCICKVSPVGIGKRNPKPIHQKDKNQDEYPHAHGNCQIDTAVVKKIKIKRKVLDVKNYFYEIAKKGFAEGNFGKVCFDLILNYLGYFDLGLYGLFLSCSWRIDDRVGHERNYLQEKLRKEQNVIFFSYVSKLFGQRLMEKPLPNTKIPPRMDKYYDDAKVFDLHNLIKSKNGINRGKYMLSFYDVFRSYWFSFNWDEDKIRCALEDASKTLVDIEKSYDNWCFINSRPTKTYVWRIKKVSAMKKNSKEYRIRIDDFCKKIIKFEDLDWHVKNNKYVHNIQNATGESSLEYFLYTNRQIRLFYNCRFFPGKFAIWKNALKRLPRALSQCWKKKRRKALLFNLLPVFYTRRQFKLMRKFDRDSWYKSNNGAFSVTLNNGQIRELCTVNGKGNKWSHLSSQFLKSKANSIRFMKQDLNKIRRIMWARHLCHKTFVPEIHTFVRKVNFESLLSKSISILYKYHAINNPLTALALPTIRSEHIMTEYIRNDIDTREYARAYNGELIREMENYLIRYEKNVMLEKNNPFTSSIYLSAYQNKIKTNFLEKVEGKDVENLKYNENCDVLKGNILECNLFWLGELQRNLYERPLHWLAYNSHGKVEHGVLDMVRSFVDYYDTPLKNGDLVYDVSANLTRSRSNLFQGKQLGEICDKYISSYTTSVRIKVERLRYRHFRMKKVQKLIDQDETDETFDNGFADYEDDRYKKIIGNSCKRRDLIRHFPFGKVKPDKYCDEWAHWEGCLTRAGHGVQNGRTYVLDYTHIAVGNDFATMPLHQFDNGQLIGYGMLVRKVAALMSVKYLRPTVKKHFDAIAQIFTNFCKWQLKITHFIEYVLRTLERLHKLFIDRLSLENKTRINEHHINSYPYEFERKQRIIALRCYKNGLSKLRDDFVFLVRELDDRK